MNDIKDTLISIADLSAPNPTESIHEWLVRAVAEDIITDKERMQMNRSITVNDGPGAAAKTIASIRAELSPA